MGKQTDWAELGWYVPVAQSAHAALPVVVLILPMGQAVHTTEPTEAAKLPAVQVEHVVDDGLD